jgi:class 3 adenylate cyclase
MMIRQDEDFNAFRILVSSALTPNVPLDLNLRAVMAPALHKLMLYCGAQTAIHLFVNPEVHEVHALVVGPDCLPALRQEEYRRNNRDQTVPTSSLPEYGRLAWEEDDPRNGLFGALEQIGEERFYKPLDQERSLLLLLRDLYKERKEAFAHRPDDQDSVLVFPLQSLDHPRLGFFVLWSPKDDPELQHCHQDAKHQKNRVRFRLSLEQIVAGLFANFYGMRPDTYLPSFCRPESKNVTLLCATLRGLDRLSECVDRRRDMDYKEKSECIPKLIRGFNNVVAGFVRNHRGRIDQLWGDGVLAVFGEYLDSADSTPRPGCKSALHTAGQVVLEFREVAGRWLKNDFKLEAYERVYAEAVSVSIAVAIHHGEVRLDYVGDQDDAVYIATGEQVNLVKHMAELGDDKPIILSRSAEYWLRDSVRDLPGMTAGEIRIARLICLPPRHEQFPIFLLEPDNIDLVKR